MLHQRIPHGILCVSSHSYRLDSTPYTIRINTRGRRRAHQIQHAREIRAKYQKSYEPRFTRRVLEGATCTHIHAGYVKCEPRFQLHTMVVVETILSRRSGRCRGILTQTRGRKILSRIIQTLRRSQRPHAYLSRRVLWT